MVMKANNKFLKTAFFRIFFNYPQCDAKSRILTDNITKVITPYAYNHLPGQENTE